MNSIKLVFRAVDLHKLRNFAEELSGSLGEFGKLPMSEADTAIDVLVVTKIRRARIRRCRSFIEKLLEKHFLKDHCEIVELRSELDMPTPLASLARAAIAVSVVGTALLLSSPAQSCTMYQNFRLEAIKNASVVFRGRVVDYTVARDPRFRFATIGFKLVELYRGEWSDPLRLAWYNSTFQLPATWHQSPDAIVAAVPNPYPTASNERLAVLQEACSSPFLLEDTPKIRDKVRALVAR